MKGLIGILDHNICAKGDEFLSQSFVMLFKHCKPVQGCVSASIVKKKICKHFSSLCALQVKYLAATTWWARQEAQGLHQGSLSRSRAVGHCGSHPAAACCAGCWQVLSRGSSWLIRAVRARYKELQQLRVAGASPSAGVQEITGKSPPTLRTAFLQPPLPHTQLLTSSFKRALLIAKTLFLLLI